MIVCIAEKPAVAREIADVLGAKTKKEGYIEGNGYQVPVGYCKYVFKSPFYERCGKHKLRRGVLLCGSTD